MKQAKAKHFACTDKLTWERRISTVVNEIGEHIILITIKNDWKTESEN